MLYTCYIECLYVINWQSAKLNPGHENFHTMVLNKSARCLSVLLLVRFVRQEIHDKIRLSYAPRQ